MLNILKGIFGGGTANEEVRQAVETGAMLVDVRTPAEFASGSAKGAVNIPLSSLASQASRLKGKKVVVFCRSGARSAQAKSILQQQGISVINGGSLGSLLKSVS